MGEAATAGTVHLPTEDIVADEFQRGPHYRVVRPTGSGDWLLILTLEGAGEIRTAGQALNLPRGHVVIFRPSAAQDYRTAPGGATWRLAWAHFQPRHHWLAWTAGWPQCAPGVTLADLGSLAPDATSALHRAVRAARSTLHASSDFALNALEEVLLWLEVTVTEVGRSRMDGRVRRAVDHLVSHVDAPFHMQTLAQAAGLSASRLAHLFRAQTGQTPQRFAEAVKMARARRLLSHTSSSIAEIATACGYEDPLYFSRRFAAILGTSPRSWRRATARQIPHS